MEARQLLLLLIWISLPCLNAQPSTWNWVFSDYVGISWNTAEAKLFFPKLKQINGSSVSENRKGKFILAFNPDGIFSLDYIPVEDQAPAYPHDLDYRSKLLVPHALFNGAYMAYWLAPSAVHFRLYHQAVQAQQLFEVMGNPQAIYDSLGPALEIVRINGHKDFWLISHLHESNRFMSLRFTNGSITDTTFSRIGQPGKYRVIRACLDGSRLFLGKDHSDPLNPTPENFIVAKFNKFSGAIDTLDTALIRSVPEHPYSASFSPDGKKLYVVYEGLPNTAGSLVVYDLNLPNPVEKSKTVAQNPEQQAGFFGMIQMGPDHHLYMTVPGLNAIARIACPDSSDAEMHFVMNHFIFHGKDSFQVTRMLPMIPEPEKSLPIIYEDTVYICNSQPLIKINGEWESLRWEDENGVPVSYPQTTGKFYVRARRGCQEYMDSILVEQVSTELDPIMPNVFTPNWDGMNDSYQVILTGPLKSYELRIFNRWGEEVFASENPFEGWNGQSGFMEHPAGVYYAVLHYQNCKGDLQKVVRAIHLFR